MPGSHAIALPPGVATGDGHRHTVESTVLLRLDGPGLHAALAADDGVPTEIVGVRVFPDAHGATVRRWYCMVVHSHRRVPE
jgi:hypothetical protein